MAAAWCCRRASSRARRCASSARSAARIFYGMPNMVQAIAEHPDRPNYDISCLRAGGTLGTPEQLQRIVDLGVTDFSTIYGLTESYGNCTVADAARPAGDPRRDGRPAAARRRSAHHRRRDRQGAAARHGRRDPAEGLRDDRLLQGRGQEPRGVRRRRLFPHRRSRLPRRRPATCTSAGG